MSSSQRRDDRHDLPTPASPCDVSALEDDDIILHRMDEVADVVNYKDFHVQHAQCNGNDGEHFDFRHGSRGHRRVQYERTREGSICPTCQGSGYLPFNDCDELTALIPSYDKRLKPSRTTLYVVIAIIFTLLIAFLLTFFLFPRSPTVSVSFLSPSVFHIPKLTSQHKTVFFTVMFQVNVTNHNFFPMELTDIKMIMIQTSFLSFGDIKRAVKIDARSDRMVTQDANGTIKGDEGLHIVAACELGPSAERIFLAATVDVHLQFLSKTSVSSHNIFSFFPC